MPFDAISETRLGDVAPQLAEKIRMLGRMLDAEGIDIRVTQSLRPWKYQEELYAQGRTLPGNIVTNAKPGYSWHNFGLAVDVAPFVGNIPDWNIDHPVWKRISSVGESLGLVSGATWRIFPDWPHLQYTGRFPVTPNDEARRILQMDGVTAVWQAAFQGLDTHEEVREAAAG